MARALNKNSLEEANYTLSLPEKLIMAVVTLSIGILLLNSCWSLYLLHTGMTGGGGPLGLLVKTIVSLSG